MKFNKENEKKFISFFELQIRNGRKKQKNCNVEKSIR